MKNRLKKLFLASILFIVCFFCIPALAGGDESQSTSLNNPLGTSDVFEIMGGVVSAGMGVLGSISLLVFVYGGLMWLLSGGNEERVKKGSQTMVWAAIGIFIIFSSYAILNTIISGITGTGELGQTGEMRDDSQCVALDESSELQWACRNLSQCSAIGIGPHTETTEQLREICRNNPDTCQLGLCLSPDSASDIVCCVE